MASAKREGFYKRGESRFWWCRTDPVTGKACSTGCTDLEAAKLWRAGRERLAADPAYAASLEATFGEWAQKFLASKRRDGSSKDTVDFYRWKLGHPLRFWGADRKLATIDPTTFDEYVAQRRAETASDHTISREVDATIQALKLAKRAGVYSADLTTLRPPDLHASYVPRKRTLSRSEVARLRAHLSPIGDAFVCVCLALGCRRSEALKLQPSDIDMAAGVAFIRGTKTEGAEREVPVLSVFRELLEAAMPMLPLDPSRRAYVSVELRRACLKAGIPHASPNDLRRTHATWLLEAGVDRDVIRRLLGHTTTRLVDQVYGRPAPAALAALAEERLATVPLQVTSETPGNLAKFRARRRKVRPCPPISSGAGEPECNGNPGNIRIVTAGRRWLRLVEKTPPGTVPLQGIWLGRRGRAVA